MSSSVRALSPPAIVLVLLSVVEPATAAFEVKWPDARSAAMLERGSIVSDLLSEDYGVTVSGGELFGLSQAAGGGLSARVLVAGTPVGVSATVLGGELYQERSLSLGASRALVGDVAVAASVRLSGIGARGVEDRWAVALDVGVRKTTLGRIELAALLENLTRAEIGGSEMTARTSLGLALSLDSARLAVGTTVEEGFAPATSIAIEMDVTDWMRWRASVGSSPGRVGFGLGLGRKDARPNVDMAWQWHPRLGVSAFVSVSIAM